MTLTPDQFLRAARINVNFIAQQMGFPPENTASGASSTLVWFSNAGMQPVNQVLHGWTRLPREIKNKIVEEAMTAKDGYILMPCLTFRESEPDIALSLLRTGSEFYDMAFRSLYKNNIVEFDNFGSDMKTMCNVFKEIRGATPTFGHVVLRLGDGVSSILGMMKLHSFASVLEHLSTPLKVNNLTIILELCSFEAKDQVKAFAARLFNIKVHDRFEIYGFDIHLKYGVREFSKALKMNITPVDTKFQCHIPATEDSELTIGDFSGSYARATNKKQLVEQPGQVIDDATSRYLAWMKAARA